MSIALVTVLTAGTLAVWGYRDLRVPFALLVAALVLNVRFPTDVLGLPLTSQRVAALVALGVCGLLFVQGRVRLPVPSAGQLWFAVAYGVIVVIDGVQFLLTTDGAARSNLTNGVLNLVLFYLVILILGNLEPGERRSLLDTWIPAIVTVVMIGFLALWVREMVERPTLDMLEVRQGYRLRNAGERNIVNIWAASLVLAAGLVSRPFLAFERTDRSLLSLTALATLSLAVVLTFSRAALLALLVTFSVGLALALPGWLARLRQRRQAIWFRLAGAFAGLAAGLTVLVVIMESMGLPVVRWTIDRVQPVLAGNDPSVAARFDRYEMTWDLLGRLPFLGFGPGSETIARLPENTILLVILHYGPVALVCFCAMLGVICWETGRWWWGRRRDASAAVVPAVLSGYLVLLITNDFLFFSMGTLSLAFVTFFCAEGCRRAETGGETQPGVASNSS